MLRSPLLRKALQGDVLFSLVLRVAPLFKQHPGKASHEKHISSILRLSWLCKGRRGWKEGGREGGTDECVSSSVATHVGVKAAWPEEEKSE